MIGRLKGDQEPCFSMLPLRYPDRDFKEEVERIILESRYRLRFDNTSLGCLKLGGKMRI